ncbi:MAG TPA: asparagine synthase-related protein [Bryobacteraceae bacterium]|nr:asparagine synthase-related protein [Bryobacteraceae bacterium]
MKTREEHQNPDLSFFHGRLPYTGHYSIELPASTTAPAASKSFADGWTIFAVGSVLSDTPNPLDAVHKAVSRSSNSDLAALNGSFCFVAINETIQKAVLAVDRLATRPIYFEPAAHGVRFSSDLRSFGRGNLNLSAAAGVLASGHVHNDDTWIRGVYYLRPGHYVCIEQGRHTVEKYWDYQLRPVDYDLETRQTRLAELLIQAVERRTRSSNVGLFLSGGYDSRAILGACLELGRPVTLLSFGGNSEPGSDYAIARTIADVTGLPFVALDYVPPSIQDAVRQTTLPFGAMRYPIQEMTAFANFPAHLDTVLFGEEAFGRIPYPLRTPEDALFALGIRNLSDVGVWRKILRPAAYRELCHLQAESLKKMVNRARSCPDLHAVKDYIYVTERMPRSGLMARQFVNQFAEVSYPWLDSEVLDFMSTVPSSLRIGKTLY